MPSILVVEQEPHYVERIKGALSAEGWRVRAVPSVDQALQSAAAEPPDLVMADTALPGFEVLLFSFSRTTGGPGVLGMAPAGGAGRADGLDGRLAKPFNDQQVVLAARQVLLAGRRQGAAAVAKEQKLTSLDIFGDVLAEVESDVPAAARPAAPPPVVPRPAPPSPPSAPAPVAAKAAPPPAADEEIQRRLEKTLSGVLGTEARPRPAAAAPSSPAAPRPPAAPPRRPPEPTAGEVDALLSKTLSNLELGKTKTGVRPPVPAVPAAPPAARVAPPPAPPPAAAAPAAPVREATAVRKPAAVGDFDFSELEDLARGGRPAPAATAPAAPRPAPSPAAAPPPRPTPVQAPAPAPPPAAPLVAPPPAEPVPSPQGPPAPSLAADAAATQRIPVFLDESPDQPGARFGQYTLLERVAVGGMAEVWKARMRGVEGFQKTVAIKRILPHMTDNSEFVDMFIDEAKLAAQLTHPNIVHIYDLGRMGRDYYIAMEYVEGKDLRSLLNAGRRRGAPLPLGLGLLIAARVASALDYAHRKRDFEDRELGLVHRDISPQNVLLTYEGDVKLCDFGIVKAVSKASHTQMGALKGKLQYMSPEQAWGRPVDPRSDLFSLGSVLFEMITGERLFPGDSEMSVLEAVRQGQTRTPRQVNPAIPREVDEIVARAIAIDPNARFQSAGEMKQRLESALAALTPTPGPTDLAAYLRHVLEAAPPADQPETAPPPREPFAWDAEPKAPATAVDLPSGNEVAVEPVAPLVEVAMEEGGRKSRTLLYAAIAALLVVAVLAFWFLSRRREAAPAPQSAGPSAPPAEPVPAANPSPGTVPPPAPAGQTNPAAAGAPMPADVKALVDQQLAAKEEEMRRRLEQQQKDLEKQLAEAKAKGQPVPAPALAQQAPAEATPAPTRPTVAEPTPSAPAPEPQREAAPVPVQEKPPEPEPQKAVPEPEPAPQTRVGDLVGPGPGVAPPQLVSFPKAEYPPMARTLRVEGTVIVSVLVDENGQVAEVRMAEPIPRNVGINEAALRAARSARYKPATKDGVRVKMWTRLKIPFKL